MSSPQTTESDLAALVEAIRSRDRFLLTTHENPDGDAHGPSATIARRRSAHGSLPRRVGARRRITRTPTREFVYHDTTDRVMRREELLGDA